MVARAKVALVYRKVVANVVASYFCCHLLLCAIHSVEPCGMAVPHIAKLLLHWLTISAKPEVFSGSLTQSQS